MKRAPSPWSSTASAPSADDAEPNVASLCPRLKWRYERCFQQWYTADFLTGHSTQLPCQDEYKLYQQCILVRIHSAPYTTHHQHSITMPLLLTLLLTTLPPPPSPPSVRSRSWTLSWCSRCRSSTSATPARWRRRPPPPTKTSQRQRDPLHSPPEPPPRIPSLR